MLSPKKCCVLWFAAVIGGTFANINSNFHCADLEPQQHVSIEQVSSQKSVIFEFEVKYYQLEIKLLAVPLIERKIVCINNFLYIFIICHTL